jgi:hypothetical protein
MLWGTLTVAAMVAAALVALDILTDWVGDYGAPLWISAGFFFPFIAGIAIGPWAGTPAGRAAGAVIGAAFVLVPGAIYVLVQDPDLSAMRLPLLWAVLTPLAAAQGAIGIPVAARARRRAS